MPLVVVTMADVQITDWRSRPGSDPGPHSPRGGVAIEGIEDLLELLRVGAA